MAGHDHIESLRGDSMKTGNDQGGRGKIRRLLDRLAEIMKKSKRDDPLQDAVKVIKSEEQTKRMVN